MNDRRFEKRISELEAEAAESEALAAKCFQESVQFESELKVAKARLAEAEKALAEERGVSSTTIAGCIKFEEENRALSARIRELEGALGPVIDRRSMLVDEPLVVTLCLTRDEYARAARALKGEG